MGCGQSATSDDQKFLVLRDSMVGAVVHSTNLHSCIEKFKSEKVEYMHEAPRSNKAIVVSKGEFTLCVFNTGTTVYDADRVLAHSVRTIKKGESLGWFNSPESESGFVVKCIASSADGGSIETIPRNGYSEVNTYNELVTILGTKIDAILAASPLFYKLTAFQRQLIGPLMRLERVDIGNALTRKGLVASDSDNELCCVFLSGQIKELSSTSNYEYPLNFHNLHGVIPKPQKTRRNSQIEPITVEYLEIKDAEVTRTLNPGDTVGEEICCFPGIESSATYVATTKSLVGYLSISSLKSLGNIFQINIEKLLHNGSYAQILKRVQHLHPVLRLMTESELLLVAEGCQLSFKTPGQSIVDHGVEIHSLYVLYQGIAQVSAKEVRDSSKYSVDAVIPTDQEYPFSVYSPAADKLATTRKGAISKRIKDKQVSYNISKLNVLGTVSAITPTCSAHNIVAATENSKSNGKTVVLEIPQKIIDAVMFQNQHQAEATNQILSAVDDVDFVYVLRHTVGCNALLEYLLLERSAEGIFFWKAVERYIGLMSRFEIPFPVVPNHISALYTSLSQYIKIEMIERLQLAHEILLSITIQFVREGSYYQVNIPHTLRKQIEISLEEIANSVKTLIETAGSIDEKASSESIQAFLTSCNNTFGLCSGALAKAKQEVYLLLREDSFKRWRRTEGFSKFIKESISLNQIRKSIK